jgi:uncharacterized membrane protein
MNVEAECGSERSSRTADRDLWAPRLSPGRIEALTDGTFAIAMTILVLELPVPHLLESSISGEHPTSFIEMWAEFYIYVLGFIVLGIYWILHHYMFQYIKRSDGVLLWLNILLLIFAALVPFSTKVLNVNQGLLPGGQQSAAGIFFGITTVASILILLGMWEYAVRGYRLVHRDINDQIITALRRVILVGVAIFSIGIALSYLVPLAGYLGFLAMAFMVVMTAHGKYVRGFGKR